MKPPVPAIEEITWPKADADELPVEMGEDGSDLDNTHHKYARAPIGE